MTLACVPRYGADRFAGGEGRGGEGVPGQDTEED